MYSGEELLLLGAHTSDQELLQAAASLTCNEVISMQYTSGTTGFPKGGEAHPPRCALASRRAPRAPWSIMKRVMSDMRCREITIAYGLNEASPVITQTSTEDQIGLRVSAVGQRLPGMEARIVNPVTDVEVPPGGQGEEVSPALAPTSPPALGRLRRG